MWRVQARVTSGLVRTIKRTLYNPRIYHKRWEYNHDQRLKFYPIVGLRGKRSATLMLNKPNYNNKLSSECVDEMYRFFRSFDTDGSVNHIWVQNKGVNCFSSGLEMNDLVNDPDYLRKVFQLSTMIARINKPILGHVKGLVGGAAAYILRTMSSPFGHSNTHLKLDDIDKGWIPICGGTYHLTRMQGDIGTYLALTGDQINVDEMGQLGFLYGKLREGKKGWQYAKMASDKSAYMPHEMAYDTYDMDESPEKQDQISYTGEEAFYDSAYLEREDILTNADNKQDLIIEITKSLMKQRQFETVNAKNPANKIGDSPATIINYFHYRQGTVLHHLKQEGVMTPLKGSQFHRFPAHKINEIFHYDTIEQILEGLQKDGSDWAKQTHAKLLTKNPLALKLTLRLIRQARNSDYTACIERQYQVASNLLKSQQFREFHSTGKSTLELSDLTAQRLAPFFNSKQQTGELQHGLKPYSLYPTKDFKDYLPDSIRYYLNRDFWDSDFRQNQSIEITRWLDNNRVVTHGLTWDLDVLREAVYNKILLQRKLQARLDTFHDVLYKAEVRDQYVTRREGYVKEFFNDQDKARQFVDSKIVELFGKRVQERITDLKDTAESYGIEQKSKLLVELRGILLKNRLTENLGELKDSDNIRHLGLTYFSKDGKGIFQSFNDSLAETPLRHLKQSIEQQDLLEPKPLTPLQGQKLNQSVYPVLVNRKYTAQNPNYREYIYRYGQEPEHLKVRTDMPFRALLLSIFEEAGHLVKDFFKEGEEVDTIGELREAVKLTYGDLIESLREKIAQVKLTVPKIWVEGERVRLVELLENPSNTIDQDVVPLDNQGVEGVKAEGNSLKTEQKQQEKEQQEIQVQQQEKNKVDHVIPVFDDTTISIPVQLQAIFRPLLQQIYTGVCSKFKEWTKTSPLNSLGHLDSWIRETISLDFNRLVKYDVVFLFSYFSIKKMQAIFSKLIKLEGDEVSLILSILEGEWGIKFRDQDEANHVVHAFMTHLVDIYGLSKPLIKLPACKMLQKKIRMTANSEIFQNNKLTLETFLLSLGEERAKLIRRVEPQTALYGDNPEYGMEALKAEFTLDRGQVAEWREKEAAKQVTISRNHTKTMFDKYYGAKKRLVQGYAFYFREISKMFQVMLGRDSFLPEELAKTAKLAEIPKYYDEFDPRKPVEKWFEDKLEQVLRIIFDFRLQCEKDFSRSELIAFDKGICLLLTPAYMRSYLLNQLSNDLKVLDLIKTAIARQTDAPVTDTPFDQRMFIRNPDALRHLNNLMTTIKIQSIDNDGSEGLPQQYLPTIERLIGEMYRDPERKHLDEQTLQKANFTDRSFDEYADKETEKHKAKIVQDLKQFIKEKGQDDIGLFNDLKKLCQINKNDRLFEELGKALKEEEKNIKR